MEIAELHAISIHCDGVLAVSGHLEVDGLFVAFARHNGPLLIRSLGEKFRPPFIEREFLQRLSFNGLHNEAVNEFAVLAINLVAFATLNQLVRCTFAVANGHVAGILQGGYPTGLCLTDDRQ